MGRWWESLCSQADGGIRGYKVTGVQTCALPISEHGEVLPGGGAPLVAARAAEVGGGVAGVPGGSTAGTAAHASLRVRGEPLLRVEALVVGGRSEERRVGKEGRSRWSPYH